MLITDFTLEYTHPRKALIAWTGDAAKYARIYVNARQAETDFLHGTTSKEQEVHLYGDQLHNIEIHEYEPGATPPKAIGYDLRRNPLIHWTHVAGAVRYKIYRKKNYNATETVENAFVEGAAHYIEHIMQLDQRQPDPQWNFYRVEGVNSQGVESSGGSFAHRVPGLPPLPENVTVSEAGSNVRVTLDIGE